MILLLVSLLVSLLHFLTNKAPLLSINRAAINARPGAPARQSLKHRIDLASHIKPYYVCDKSERANPANGLLLNAFYDRAFDRLPALSAEVGLALVGVMEPFTAPAARALQNACITVRVRTLRRVELAEVPKLVRATDILIPRAHRQRNPRCARRGEFPAMPRPLCQSSHALSSLISVALVPVGITLLPVKIVGTEDALLRLVDLYAPVFSLIALREGKPSLIK